MLHLAQVIKKNNSDEIQLNLLAVQESKLQWTFCHEKYLTIENPNNLQIGNFILIKLGENNDILYYEPAKDWILSLVKTYLIEGKSNANINIPEEQARLEKWRQELTSQSQDLTRIRLEIETTKEELEKREQDLE
jgi:hypothetical protein